MRTLVASLIAAASIVLSFIWFSSRYDASPRWTTFVDRGGAVIGTIDPAYQGLRIWTPIEEIPDALIRGVLQAEDRFFFWHRGINPLAVIKAAIGNMRAGRIIRGGSTITQQLAKNLIQEREGHAVPRTFVNKLREAAIAIGLEAKHSKRWILERYLNSIYYGRRAWGVGAAADLYFGKRPSMLTAEQIALFVRIPKAPSRLAPPVAAASINPRSVGRHFIEYVSCILPPGDGRRRIATTLDVDLERRVEEAVAAVLQDRLEEDPLLTAAVVVIDVATGDVLAMAGSRDYFDETIDGQVNAAVARRQPGSALKPFTYFAAFLNGFAANSIVPDEPLSFAAVGFEDADGYAPQNFDRRYHGEMTIREALANSYNVPAVVTLNEIGLSFYHDLLKGFGFTTFTRPPMHYGLAVTLGAGEVTLVELTNAYAALARGGAFLPYRLEPARMPTSAVSVMPGAREATAEVTAILSDPDARLKAFGYNESMQVEGHPVAVKTGTSYEHRDNWTVGYTPEFAIGVWVGHADGSPMDPETSTGATGAAPLWHAVMERLVRGRTPRPFPLVASAQREPPAAKAAIASTPQAPRTFRVTAPVPNTTYRIHPFLPRDHQGIVAQGEARGEDAVELRWSLDGRFLESTAGETSRVVIEPTPGKHMLRAESNTGEGIDIPFRVMEDEDGTGGSL